MLRIAIVTFLIGLCTSFPVRDEHERSERSVSNEKTNRDKDDDDKRTSASSGTTGATRGAVQTGGFFQNPSLPSNQPFSPNTSPTQVITGYNPYAPPTQAYNPYVPPTQFNPVYNPYAPPTQINPAYAPPNAMNPFYQPTQAYGPVYPYPSSSPSSTSLQSVLPFLLARLIPSASPMIAGN